MKKIVSKLVHIDMRFRQAWERFERALKAPLMCLFFILWLVYVFYSPRQKLENQELETLQRPRRAVNAVLDSWLTSSPEPRVEPRGGNNLEIYLPKGSFESIPYPDREDFVGDIGRAWCDNLGGRYVALPSVEIRDIRSGESLGRYNCVISAIRSRARIQPEEVEMADLRMSLIPGSNSQHLFGHVRNKSASYTLMAVAFEITIEYCRDNHCETLGSTTETLTLAVPPGQSNDLNEYVTFPSPLVKETEGEHRWYVKTLFARGG